MRRVVYLLLLIAMWLLWSGHYTWDLKHPQVAVFGLFSCLFVLGVDILIDRVAGDVDPYRLGWRPITYIPWLLWEIVKANLDVVRVVLSPKLPISPHLIRVRASQETELGRVIYANSITLTPGTVTLDVHDDILMVHALTNETSDGVLSGVMDKKCKALEGGSP